MSQEGIVVMKRTRKNITVENFGAIAAVATNFIVEVSREKQPACWTLRTSVQCFPDARTFTVNPCSVRTDLPLIIWAQQSVHGSGMNKVTWALGSNRNIIRSEHPRQEGRSFSGRLPLPR